MTISSGFARTLASVSTIALAAAGLTVGLAPAASADDFTPTASTASIAIVSSPNNLQPSGPRSVDVYTLAVDATNLDGVSGISAVTMCFYKTGASNTCANAATDPKNEFQMVWNRADRGDANLGFAVIGTNNYQNASSDFSETASVSSLNFKFKVSDAMLAGSDWTIVATVNGAANDSVTNKTVLYYGAVAVPRTGVSYASLGTNQADVQAGITTGGFLANGTSNVTIAANDFVNTDDTLTLATGTTLTPPTVGKVALDCRPNAVWSTLGTIRVGTTPVILDSAVFSVGTGESVDYSLKSSCQLAYGGGATHTGSKYSSTVTVAIGSNA